MTVLRVLMPFLTAALAAWVTRGTLAVADARGPRLGALPSLLELGIFAAIAVVLTFVTRPSPARVRPLFLSALLLWPWLPIPLPAAALIWSGPGMTVSVLIAAAIGVALTVAWPGIDRLNGIVGHPRRAPIVAAAIAFALFLAAAYRLSAFIPGGDEPHYLIIAQSLLSDGDLRIENNHARGDYAPYFDGVLKPDFLRRGRDGQIYSIHAPGLPLLIAPAYAIAGYVGVVLWLAAIAAVGGALVWRLAWRVTESPAASWIAWAAVVLSAPFFFHAFTVYPDGPAAVLALAALAALVEGRAGLQPGPCLAVHGVALAFLPWLHTRYAVISLVLGVAIVWQRRRHLRDVTFFAAVPIISAVLWFAFFYTVYGSLSPAAPYGGYTQSSPLFILTGLPGLLFDQQFGIAPHAPVYAVAVFGLWLLWRRVSFVAVTIVAVAVLYLLTAGAYRMWWGGWSAPARFAVPVLLLFSVPLAVAWHDARTAVGRAIVTTALIVSVFVTVVLVIADEGALLYNTRTGTALWLEWLGPLVDLSAGVPSFIRDARWVAIGHTAIWMFVAAATFGVWASFARRRRWNREAQAIAVPLTVAATLMISLTVVWAVRGAPPVVPASAQTTFLRNVADGGSTFVSLGSWRSELAPVAPIQRLSREDLLRSVRIGSTRRSANDTSLLTVKSLPAGRYRVHVAGRRAASGRLDAYIGRPAAGMPPLVGYELQTQTPGPTLFEIDLPTDVASLVVTGDDTARKSILGLSLEPLRVAPRDALSAVEAGAAARYGDALVLFGSGRLYPEPDGFWVGPQTDASFVVRSSSEMPLRFVLRNAPVANRIRIGLPSGTQELTLRPGETWTTPPVRATSPVIVRLKAESGFRPTDHDAQSGDRRTLAVWLSVLR
jgi:hypothetical protein